MQQHTPKLAPFAVSHRKQQLLRCWLICFILLSYLIDVNLLYSEANVLPAAPCLYGR